MDDFYPRMMELIEARTPFVAVTVVHTDGSVPQDAGSKMLVTEAGLCAGTVGGGKLEMKAIEEAKALLSGATKGDRHESTAGERGQEQRRTRFVEWNLQRDLNMVCGGAVKLFFEMFNLGGVEVVVFGAGHVSQVLVRMLLGLDCRVTCFDGREEWLAKLPASPKLRKVRSENLAGEVAKVPEGAFVILMTMGHATDKPILIEILKTREFPYLGVIGSEAKAAELRRAVREAGVPPERVERFICPIGLPIGNNHPHEIAISICGQLIEVRDRVRGDV